MKKQIEEIDEEFINDVIEGVKDIIRGEIEEV